MCYNRIMKFTVLIIYLYILGIYAVCIYGAKCQQSEYLSAAGECCPLCVVGSVVLRDCHGDNTTACQACTKGTYMNEPNWLYNCFPCKMCTTGLHIVEDCTTIQNTVCGVLDGYYCRSDLEEECSHALKHSECKPGQQIKSPGTKNSDTVCEPCPPGFYSPKGVNCSKWTDCSFNEIVEQEGTSITDVKCKAIRKRYGIIAALSLALLYSIIPLLFLYWKHRKEVKYNVRRRKNCVEETSTNPSECVPSCS